MDGATPQYIKQGSALTKIKNIIPSAGQDKNNLPYIRSL